MENPAEVEECAKSTAPCLRGLGFRACEIAQARRERMILRLTLELEPVRCELSCRYCWRTRDARRTSGLTVAEAVDIIGQAKLVGARTIVLTGGGEPTMDLERLKEVVSYCASEHLWVVLYTNGLAFDGGLAAAVRGWPISVVAKLHSVCNKDVTDWMCGVKGAHDRLRTSVDNLVRVGLSREGRLGIHTVVMRRNLGEVVTLWRWCRERGIIPFVESIKGIERAADLSNSEIVRIAELRELFGMLSRMDKQSWDYEWAGAPPIAGFGCDKWYYSLYVAACKDVYPCSGVRIPLGNLGRQSLEDVARNEMVARMKNVGAFLKGKCGTCKRNANCYGCRGNAYARYGDCFAEDPDCWIAIQSASKR